MTDSEIDLRTFLSRYLPASSLGNTLVQQVREYGKLYARRTPISIMVEHPMDPGLEEKNPPKFQPTDVAKPEALPWEDSAEEVVAEPKELELSEDQKAAWAKLLVWSKNDEPYFILRGFAGTGKTFLLQMLTKIPGLTLLYTAPTNKAAKVLGRAVGRPAKTTYSALGLRMEQDGEKMTLTYGSNVPYIPKKAIFCIDEGSMVQSELDEFVEKTRVTTGCKVLYIGDPAQLPPVGESMTKVWKRTTKPQNRAVLKHVMRFDNQLLALSVAIRDCLKNKEYRSPIEDDHDKDGGVYKLSSKQNFERAILKGADNAKIFTERKVIAWRNKTVDRYNELIRDHLGFTDDYCVGEQLMLAEPVEYDGQIIGSIDDEVTVSSIQPFFIEVDGVDIPVHRMTVTGDISMTLCVPADPDKLARVISRLAAEAKEARGLDRKHKWKHFWDTKKQFNNVRYGYAITAHRAQGSTYTEAFVDQLDILANSDKRTAFRCLYVAATRPTTRLFTY